MEPINAGVAQLAEQLICNQQVIGSSPIIGFTLSNQCNIVNLISDIMDGFPSGQRGQTVNLLQIASVVRIHLHPVRNEYFFNLILISRDGAVWKLVGLITRRS